MSGSDRTLDAYQARVPAYLATSPTEVPAPVALLLNALAERLPGGRVLELGSGPGREAAHLERRGLVVDRTDATPAFVEHLRATGVSARVLDVRSGDLGGPYDAVLANAVLLHLDRDDLATALVRCLRATRPGGLLAVTVKEGDGEAWSEARLGLPRWYVYWREAMLRAVLVAAGWEVESIAHVAGQEPWLHALCHRPGQAT